MAKVRIRKALQIKNRLAGEVANLNKLIQSHNSRREDAPKNFDVTALILDRENAVKKLIAVKTALAKANVSIYGHIYHMAELKDEIKFYRSLNTTEGSDEVGYGERARQVKISATINAANVESKVNELTIAIEKLQDEIDYFNSTTEIEVSV